MSMLLVVGCGAGGLVFMSIVVFLICLVATRRRRRPQAAFNEPQRHVSQNGGGGKNTFNIKDEGECNVCDFISLYDLIWFINFFHGFK